MTNVLRKHGRCPECGEPPGAHAGGCSWRLPPADRVAFVVANAVSLVEQRDRKIALQTAELARLNQRCACLTREREALRAVEHAARAVVEQLDRQGHHGGDLPTVTLDLHRRLRASLQHLDAEGG